MTYGFADALDAARRITTLAGGSTRVARVEKNQPVLTRWRIWARALRHWAHTLWLVGWDRRAAWPARAVALAVAAYALSPIDLIPDVIPLLGYLDDLLLVPAGIWLALRLTPPAVLADCRARAEAAAARPRAWAGAVVVVLAWLLLAVAAVALVARAAA